MQINIPKSCNENWSNMSPEKNGRFCKSCNKNVIDFAQYSDTELFNYFKNEKKETCGIFAAQQVNRDINLKRYNTFFRLPKGILSLSILFGLNNKLQAQHLKKVETPIAYEQTIEPKLSLPSNLKAPEKIKVTISGQIVDSSMAPIQYVNVFLKDLNIGASCDKNGNFVIVINTELVFKGVNIIISSIGYETIESNFKNIDKPFKIVMKEDTRQLTGEVLIINYSHKNKLKSKIKRFFSRI